MRQERAVKAVRWRALVMLLMLGLFAQAALALPVPDLRIRNSGTSTYYSQAAQTVQCGASAYYDIAVVNVGNAAGRFAIRASANSGPWAIAYRYGSSDITSAVRSSSGWLTPSLSVGQGILIQVRVQTTSSTPGTCWLTTTGRYPYTGGASDSVRADTTFVCPPRPPVAANDTATTCKNTAVVIPVLANDYDPDGTPLTITALTAPIPGGTVAITSDQKVRFIPPPNATGTFTFTYKARDASGATSNTATVTITVTGSPSGVSLYVTPTNATTQTTVQFYATAQPPGTYNVVYQFEVRKYPNTAWTVLQSYSSSSYHASRPCSAGTWQARVLMRDLCTGTVYTSNYVTINVPY